MRFHTLSLRLALAATLLAGCASVPDEAVSR